MKPKKIGDVGSRCRDRNHTILPYSSPHLIKDMEPGVYEHRCPTCGLASQFVVPEKPVHTERYWRLGWSTHTEYERTVYAASPEEAEEKLQEWLATAPSDDLAKYERRVEGSDPWDCGAVDTREKAEAEMCNEDETILGEP